MARKKAEPVAVQPKIGRPSIPEEERAVVHAIRLTPARIEKLRQLGGAKWISERIDKARLP
jgi:hypothetical protein